MDKKHIYIIATGVYNTYRTYIYTHTYTHIYIHIHTYIYTYTYIIHKSQDLGSVGQHDLWINAPNKGNTYLSSMRSVSYLSCR